METPGTWWGDGWFQAMGVVGFKRWGVGLLDELGVQIGLNPSPAVDLNPHRIQQPYLPA